MRTMKQNSLYRRHDCEGKQRFPSNFRYTKTLAEVLEENGIPAISGVDTRMLTRILRDAQGMRAIITGIDTPTEEAVKNQSHGAPQESCQQSEL